MKPSILPPEMYGTMFISGYGGVGKSWLASQADFAENMAYYDFEEKGKTIDTQLKFGVYKALTVEATPTGATRADPLRLFNVSMQAFTKLEQDAYTVAVLDNVSPLELAIQADARRDLDYYCERFGLSKKNVLAGRFGGVKSVMNYFLNDLSNILHSKGVRLIIAVSHISDRWGPSGPIPGKYNMKGASKWQQLSILTLLLIPGDHPPIPTGIVWKESLGEIREKENPTPEEIEAMRKGKMDSQDRRRRLPFRIAKCTFQEIRRYLQEPADIAKPRHGEVPAGTEKTQFDSKLSKEQMSYVMKAMEAEERREREVGIKFGAPLVNASAPPSEAEGRMNRINALLGAGKSTEEVREATGATLAEMAGAG